MQVLRYVTFDIGICAHNEAQNIGTLLEACSSAKVHDYFLDKIIVVSSESDDGTDELVADFKRLDRRVELVAEQNRTGKSAAVNLILERSKSDIIVLISADVLPSRDMMDKLLKPFHDSRVGMVGCKVSPVNGYHTLCGNVSRFIWSLHDTAASVEPKFGEAVAFRRELVDRIEPIVIADEAYVEMKVKQAGYKMQYAQDAIVFNRGPETISELLEQRKRVYAGHLQLQMRYGYRVSTLKPTNLVKIMLRGLNRTRLRYAIAAVTIEIAARAWGTWSCAIGRKNHVWRILKTTKHI